MLVTKQNNWLHISTNIWPGLLSFFIVPSSVFVLSSSNIFYLMRLSFHFNSGENFILEKKLFFFYLEVMMRWFEKRKHWRISSLSLSWPNNDRARVVPRWPSKVKESCYEGQQRGSIKCKQIVSWQLASQVKNVTFCKTDKIFDSLKNIIGYHPRPVVQSALDEASLVTSWVQFQQPYFFPGKTKARKWQNGAASKTINIVIKFRSKRQVFQVQFSD